jgi:hypothetical protein
MDILDLSQVRAQYWTEQLRDWFGVRYTDILEAGFGSNVNIDADERPNLVMRKTSFLSGYDVDGTGDASLGQYSGKSAGVCTVNVPRRFFAEHGSVWIMALLRFPTIHEQEIHYLFKKSNPTYKEISGDHRLWEMEPPIDHDVGDFFTGSSSTQDLGTSPYGQWYRMHPSIVHQSYQEVQGFTFTKTIPASIDAARYIQADEFQNTFQTNQLGDWQSQGRIDVTAMRPIGAPLQSVFAGVK